MTGASIALWEIFLFIFLSSLFSFGGGNGQIPVIQGRWVESGALDPGLFSFALALTYLTPGPKAGFIAGVGYYLAGPAGAVVAVLGLVIPTCIGTGLVSLALGRMRSVLRIVAPSSGFVLAALIAAAAWGTARPMGLGAVDGLGVLAIAVLVVWRSLSPVWLVLGAIVTGLVFSFVAANL